MDINFTNLSTDDIINAVSSIGNGRMARICYKSELPVKAEYTKKGIKIVKVTEATVRFGVDYEHISTVIEKKKSDDYTIPAPRENNYRWTVENKVCHNDKTGKDYIRFASVNQGANRKVLYIVIDSMSETTTVESLDDGTKNMIQNSYWNKGNVPEVQNISIENVLRINKIGKKLF